MSDPIHAPVLEYKNEALDLYTALKRLNELAFGVTPIAYVDRDCRFEHSWESPSLFGHLAMQAIQDLLGEVKMLTCRCGVTFSTVHNRKKILREDVCQSIQEAGFEKQGEGSAFEKELTKGIALSPLSTRMNIKVCLPAVVRDKMLPGFVRIRGTPEMPKLQPSELSSQQLAESSIWQSRIELIVVCDGRSAWHAGRAIRLGERAPTGWPIFLTVARPIRQQRGAD